MQESAEIKTKIKTIGIVGGGQLGRMICFAAHQMGYKTVILNDKYKCPASYVTKDIVVGDYKDYSILDKFIAQVDIVTFEFENIPFETINYINKKIPTYPNPKILKITQNRLLEKRFLQKIAVKTADFFEINNYDDLKNGFDKFGKAILKTALMGYDGKGQVVINESEDLFNLKSQIDNNIFILEKFCPFDFEVSVIVARSIKGEIKSFEPVQNIHKNSILDKTIYPSQLSKNLAIKAQEIAEKIAQEIDLVGILAVEFFVIKDQLLVNELAPRPHNSGHITMNLCQTSQFEQLIRAITNIKLGDTDFFAKGYMQNLIGDQILLIDEYKNMANAKIHLYDKDKIAKGRKMGHVNIIEQKI